MDKATHWHQDLKSTRTARTKKTATKTNPTMKLQTNNKMASMVGSGFFVPSPDNNCNDGIDSAIGGCLLIDSQSCSDAVNEDCTNNITSGICRLNKNNNKILSEEEAEDGCVGSLRENRRTDFGTNKDDNEDNTKILLRIQGADLRRFDNYKKRFHVTTAHLWYKCKKHNTCMELATFVFGIKNMFG